MLLPFCEARGRPARPRAIPERGQRLADRAEGLRQLVLVAARADRGEGALEVAERRAGIALAASARKHPLVWAALAVTTAATTFAFIRSRR